MNVVRFALITGAPYVYPCANANFNNSVECPKPGIFPEYIHNTFTAAGISYESYPIIPSYYVNGTWNGSYALVLNGSLDMIGYFWIRTPFRAQFFDFSYPVYTEKPYFLVQKKKVTWISVAMVPFIIFEWTTWLAIGVTVGLLILISSRLGKSPKKNKLWNLLVLAINNSQEYLREKWFGGHVILAILGLFVTLYINLYQGTLLTHLLHPPEDSHFSDWKEMMDKIEAKELNLIVSSPTYWYLQAAENSDAPYFVRLRQALSVNPAIVEENKTKILEMVKTGPYLYPVRSVRATYLASFHCDLDLVRGDTLPAYWASLATAKNSSTLPILNAQILKSYGLISELITKYLASSKQCEYEQKFKKMHLSALNLFTMSGVGLLYFVGHLFGSAYLCWERYSTRKVHQILEEPKHSYRELKWYEM